MALPTATAGASTNSAGTNYGAASPAAVELASNDATHDGQQHAAGIAAAAVADAHADAPAPSSEEGEHNVPGPNSATPADADASEAASPEPRPRRKARRVEGQMLRSKSMHSVADAAAGRRR